MIKILTRIRTPDLFLSLGAAVALYGLDQWLKAWSTSNLKLYQRVPIFGQDVLVLSRVLNSGVMGNHYGGILYNENAFYIRYLPTAVITSLALFAALRWKVAGKLERIAYSLMLACGVSNLGDHWRSAFVTDTLQIWIGGKIYLPFNIADVGLIGGVVLLLVSFAREIFAADRGPQGASRAQAGLGTHTFGVS